MYIHDSYIDAGRGLPKRERERYYTALIVFVQYGEEPNLSNAAAAIFTAIRPAMELSKKRAKAGSKGGLQRAKSQAKGDFACKQNPSKNEASHVAKDEFASAIDIYIPTTNNINTTTNTTSNVTVAGTRPVKHRHGTHGNVLLTDDELEKLESRFPDDWRRRIDDLSHYIGSTGKSYKSHYMTILNWARKEEPKEVSLDDYWRKYD